MHFGKELENYRRNVEKIWAKNRVFNMLSHVNPLTINIVFHNFGYQKNQYTKE